MAKLRKAVLITGGVKRLGLALARQCLEMGYHVIAHYRSSKGALPAWLKKHPAFTPRVHLIQGDLLNCPESIVAKAGELPVTLEGLVNSASLFSEGNLRDPNHFETTLAVNALAPLRLAVAFSQNVRTGWIINITDAHVASMNSTYQNYRISKKLLEELTTQLAFTLAPAFRVNAIAPGAVLPPPGKSHTHFRQLSRQIPLRRTVPVRAITDALTYLIAATSVTGQVLHVDNGWHICP